MVLDVGASAQRFLEPFRKLSAASTEFTCSMRYQRDDCHLTVFEGLPVDVKPAKGTMGSDGACRTTDVLECLIDTRSESHTFATDLKSIQIFKLICHHLGITQHHWQPRGGKFKAITLSDYVVAVCDTMKPNVTVVEAIHLLCQAFVRFGRCL